MKIKIAKTALTIGRRGAFLIFLFILDIIYGYSLLTPSPRTISSPTYVFLQEVMGLKFWAALWIFTGLICIYYAFREKDAVGYATAMFLKTLWALLFLLGWIFADVERGYLSTIIWGSFAAVIGLIASWPEPHHFNPTRGE